METIAYLYAAACEANEHDLGDEVVSLPGLSWHQVSAQTTTSVLAIACSLSVLGTASVASALQRDDVGTDVTNLQSELTRAGYYDGPVTGFYGELTESAVSRFQAENGLVVDGVAGSATLDALQSRVTASQSPTNTVAGGTLRRGDQGFAVTDLQTRLRNAGYFNGPVTGYFGSLTEAAVSRFQQQKGLVVDGEAGSQTLAALRSATTAQSPRPTQPSGNSSAQGGPATPVSTTVLSRGDRGEAVADLQNRLRNAGYFNGPMTGFYGSLTEEAVTRFQQTKGLAVDGKAGPRTLGALLQSPGSQAQSQPSRTQPNASAASSPTPAAPTTPQATSQPSILQSPSSEQPNSQQPIIQQPNSQQPTSQQPSQQPIQPSSSQAIAPQALPQPTATQSPVPAASTTPDTPSSGTVSSSAVLAQGSSGPEVAALQTALKQRNYLTGQVTGFFGPLTEQALTRFQTENGLPATGKADAATLDALKGQSPQGDAQGNAGSVNASSVLERGDRGAAVADLQDRLRRAGYFEGPMTGFYGELTEVAVAEFQQAKGLSVDGKAGPQTLAALR